MALLCCVLISTLIIASMSLPPHTAFTISKISRGGVKINDKSMIKLDFWPWLPPSTCSKMVPARLIGHVLFLTTQHVWRALACDVTCHGWSMPIRKLVAGRRVKQEMCLDREVTCVICCNQRISRRAERASCAFLWLERLRSQFGSVRIYDNGSWTGVAFHNNLTSSPSRSPPPPGARYGTPRVDKYVFVCMWQALSWASPRTHFQHFRCRQLPIKLRFMTTESHLASFQLGGYAVVALTK